MTLTDVAQRAGVSLATASRVVNGSTRQVTGDLRDRVLRAAAELNYSPNAHAQALARSANNVVGLIVHDVDDPYFSAIASGIMRFADERGYMVMLGSTFREPERELDYVATLRAQRVRAVILAGSRVTGRRVTERLAAEISAFQATGGRVACVSQPRLPADTVEPENHEGARQLARSLADLGHRHFAVLGGPRELVTARNRVSGFKQGLADAGLTLDPADLVEGDFTRDGGYAAALDLLSRQTDVTCVFAVNDVMAVGAMSALRERGVEVPADMSIAGFDDIATVRDLVPPLTTVRLPLEDIGAQTAMLALGTDAPATPRVIRVRGDVVIRGSTRRLD